MREVSRSMADDMEDQDLDIALLDPHKGVVFVTLAEFTIEANKLNIASIELYIKSDKFRGEFEVLDECVLRRIADEGLE